MLPLARPVIYPLCLLGGSLLVAVAAAAHPDLAGDGAAQLAVIAHCETWRVIHWALLFGFALSLTGLMGVVGKHTGTAGEGAARGGVIVGTFAYGAWAVLVAFMVGPGWTLARCYIAAEPGLTATHAALLYDMLHPFALAAQRTAGFALGISTCLFGWAVVNGKVLPRWLGAGAVASGVVAIGLALAFPENTKADEAAFVLPVVWQVGEGAPLLRPFPSLRVTRGGSPRYRC